MKEIYPGGVSRHMLKRGTIMPPYARPFAQARLPHAPAGNIRLHLHIRAAPMLADGHVNGSCAAEEKIPPAHLQGAEQLYC